MDRPIGRYRHVRATVSCSDLSMHSLVSPRNSTAAAREFILPARRYASAVLAMTLCPSSRCSSEMPGPIEPPFSGTEAFFYLSHAVLYGNSGIAKSNDTSLWNFVPKSGLKKFSHDIMVAHESGRETRFENKYCAVTAYSTLCM